MKKYFLRNSCSFGIKVIVTQLKCAPNGLCEFSILDLLHNKKVFVKKDFPIEEYYIWITHHDNIFKNNFNFNGIFLFKQPNLFIVLKIGLNIFFLVHRSNNNLMEFLYNRLNFIFREFKK